MFVKSNSIPCTCLLRGTRWPRVCKTPVPMNCFRYDRSVLWLVLLHLVVSPMKRSAAAGPAAVGGNCAALLLLDRSTNKNRVWYEMKREAKGELKISARWEMREQGP